MTTLVLLAAGMATRYGSLKQMDGFGPNKEWIMDYSIHDAIKAGFGKVVFIIRKDFYEDFKALVEPKWASKVEIDYAFQETDVDFSDNPVVKGRQKAWGTAHAMLCAQKQVTGPFCILNADDCYSADAFVQMQNFLTQENSDYSFVGYTLGNTLSDNGAVSRGVCQVDENQNLVEIIENTKISKEGDAIVSLINDEKINLPYQAIASMNFWGFRTNVFAEAQAGFKKFISNYEGNEKSEYFIPKLVDDLKKEKNQVVKCLPTTGEWTGVTYPEDKALVQSKIDQWIADGKYPSKLW